MCVCDKKNDSRVVSRGKLCLRGVRDKREQMDVKKENSLAVTPRERTKSNRREVRRSADEEGVGSIARKPM